MNARALITSTGVKRVNKLNYLSNALQHADSLVLQEAHGSRESFLASTRFLDSKFLIVFSPGSRPGIGGAAFFLSREWIARNQAECTHIVFVPGRVLRNEIKTLLFIVIIWNVHNMDICSDDMIRISKQIAIDRKRTLDEPTKHVTFLTGDLNYQLPGETAVYV